MPRKRSAPAEKPLAQKRAKKLAKKAPTPKPVTPVIPTPPQAAKVTQLTARILELTRRSNRGSVATRADIGRLLLRVRNELAHGAWEPWLEAHVPFTVTTAKRAIRLHEYRQQHPDHFTRLAPLGVTKAYLFLTLPDDTVELLLDGPQLVPSTGAYKQVVAMTFAELMEVISALSDEEDLDGAERLVRNYRRRLRGLIRAIDALIEDPDAIEAADAEDEIADLYDDLLNASERLADAFSLTP